MLSIERILPRARAQYPDRPAINTGGAWLTYDQLGKRVDALAAALPSLGLARGDRVALLDVNSPACLECYFACAHAGYVFVPLNSRLAAPELTYILNDCAATVLIVSPPFFATAEGLRTQVPTLKTVVATASGLAGAQDYEDLIAKRHGQPAAAPWDAAPHDVAQIYYTSGTTGEPKGVCLTYGNMSTSAVDTIIGLGLDWDDCWLHAAPLFHLVSACAVFAMPLLGARQVALPFSPDGFLSAVEQWRVTATALPPTLINLICARPDMAASDLSSLRLIMYGGSPMPRGVISKALEVLPTSYMHAYGITETSGIVTLLRHDDILPHGGGDEIRPYGSAGHPVPNIGVEIMNDAGAIIGAGQVGEIVVSGPRVMTGYWNKPQATASAVMDGWYHTGDLGYMDSQRHLYVVDRKKDMIISGGENVYSVEVENILSTHPDVLECAVIGVPSDEWGEAVHAVIVTRDKRNVSAEDIATFCRGKIANYKIPKSISIAADPLPKTGPGKIAKRLIRDTFWQGQKTKI
jgi:long-chain acyl-CoA synthetase